ncbi:MAG: dockerin type I domain-containing protein [Candidatus Bathyarchaeota archaeon]|jgi:hypothetical protein
MIGKTRAGILILILSTLSIFSALSLGVLRVSAVEQPAIYVVPAWGHTADPTSEIGTNYTVSVYTNCTNDNIWGFEFTLSFNASILQGVEVVNGDIITDDIGPTLWKTEGFNNTEGTLGLTGNGFFFFPPDPPPVATGPGTMANVTFTIVGYGKTEITLGRDTRLIGYDFDFEVEYNIIEPPPPYDHLDNGLFYNTIPGDVNMDKVVDIFDIGKISSHWYPGPPIGPSGFDIDADINNDGAVDIFDIGITSAHWGDTYP